MKPTTKKLDNASLSKMLPMDRETSVWRASIYNGILEHRSETPLEELCEAIENMKVAKADEAKKNEQMHKANLYSLINCVDSLAALHDELERSNKAGEFAVKQIGSQIAEARGKPRASSRTFFHEKIAQMLQETRCLS